MNLRTGRIADGFALVAFGLVFAAGLAVIAVDPAAATTDRVEIHIRYSHYDQAQMSVPVGVAVTFVLRNDDPIDHEFIVGDAAVHERHRTGTEPVHGSRPTEVTIPAGTTRATTITFTKPGSYLYICHLPGHEAYGMVGTLVVRGN